MMENVPNLMREKVTKIRDSQIVSIKRNLKRSISRHILVKMSKFQDKERILKAAREKKEVTYKGAPIRLAADFSMETFLARREWQNIFVVMRTRGLQPRLLYTARLSIKRRPNKEFLRKKKSKRTHLHQTSSGRDAKWTALKKGRKREREREEHR